MRIYTKAFLAGLFTVAVANYASAQVRVGVYAGEVQPYYPPTVQVQPVYVSPHDYYQNRDGGVVPDWRDRQEWREMREREWRRVEWERQQEWIRRQEWHRHEEWRRHEEWHREHEHDDQPYGHD